MVDPATDRPPLMFVHGAWLSSSSWDTVAGYFRERGYAVSAPEWPRKEGGVEVHFTSDERAPLLIVGAEKDHTVPASVAHKQYTKYEKSNAQTDYVEFAGRPHLMMAADGWEEIAAKIDSWIESVLAPSAVGGERTEA